MDIRRIVITGAAGLALAAGGAAAGQIPAAATASGAPSRTAVPQVKLSASTGPPTSTVKVSGTGFGARRAVDIYFDTTDEALAGTNGNGAFSGITVRVPASAVPGTHYITAVQRHTGRSAQARFLVNTNWAQFRYSDNHQGFNPFENVLNPGNVAGIGQAWRYTTRDRLGAGAIYSSPAVVNGVVYFTAALNVSNSVYALNAATGAKLWRHTTETEFSSPAVANGVVYLGADNGFFYALNAATGARLWRHAIAGDEVDSSPAVANGVVYFGTFNGKVFALNAATGAKVWSFTTGDIVDSSPAVVNGVVYVGSDDNKVYALNAATGAKQWSYTTSGFVDSSPAVVNGVVYVGSNDNNGSVYALNAATGAKLWSYATGVGVTSSPAVANGIVYIGSGNGNVYALNAATGAKLWSYATGGAIYFSSPAVANGVVYIGSEDGNVYALNAAIGAELWRYTTGFNVFGSPAVANGVVYAGSVDGNMYAFSVPGGLAAPARPRPSSLHPNYALRPQQGNKT